MSGKRYITRSEGSFEIEDPEYEFLILDSTKIKRKTIKNNIGDVILDGNLKFSRFLEKFGKIEIESKSSHKFVDMIHELIPYANIINYKSFIIILCEKAEEIESIQGLINCDGNQIRKGTYYLSIDKCHRISNAIIEPTIELLQCESDKKREYEYIHPQCALLFDKNNYCRKIDLSDNILNLIFKHSLRINNNYSMFPLGYHIWKADFLFDDTDNTLYGSEFFGSEISFFSVNKPSFDALQDGIENMFPPECEKWLNNNNIQHIREDLHLNDTPERKKPKYEYINNADNEYINKMVEDLKIRMNDALPH